MPSSRKLSTIEPTDYVLWGGTGHGKVLAEIILDQGGRILAFVDNDPQASSPISGAPIFFGITGFHEWLSSVATPRKNIGALAAIGGAKGRDRCDLYELFRKSELGAPTIIHHQAVVATSARIGENSHLLAGAIVAAGCVVGHASIINTKASVDHESHLGAGVHIAPGATLCGCVHVGDYTMIGAGAVVLPRVKIGSSVIVGAGSVVTRDIPDNVVAYGNPARVMRNRTNA